MRTFFKHIKKVKQQLNNPGRHSNGTLAFVERSNGNFVVGLALCSEKDQFCKATGRDIALGRARKRICFGECDNTFIVHKDAVKELIEIADALGSQVVVSYLSNGCYLHSTNNI